MSSSNPIINNSIPIPNNTMNMNTRVSNNILDEPPQPISFILSDPIKINAIKTT